MNRDIMDYPWVRRLVKIWVAFLAVAAVFVVAVIVRRAPRRSEEWVGRSESEAVATLGKPSDEERRDPTAKDFSMTWTDSWGVRLRLEFKDGIVVRQQSGAR